MCKYTGITYWITGSLRWCHNYNVETAFCRPPPIRTPGTVVGGHEITRPLHFRTFLLTSYMSSSLIILTAWTPYALGFDRPWSPILTEIHERRLLSGIAQEGIIGVLQSRLLCSTWQRAPGLLKQTYMRNMYRWTHELRLCCLQALAVSMSRMCISMYDGYLLCTFNNIIFYIDQNTNF